MHASPCRATAKPLTCTVAEAAVTLPPWLVASPSRIIFFIVYLGCYRLGMTWRQNGAATVTGYRTVEWRRWFSNWRRGLHVLPKVDACIVAIYRRCQRELALPICDPTPYGKPKCRSKTSHRLAHLIGSLCRTWVGWLPHPGLWAALPFFGP